jgi:hypothetical protein
MPECRSEGLADGIGADADWLGTVLGAGDDGSAGAGSGGTAEAGGLLGLGVRGQTVTGAVLDVGRAPGVRSG